MSLITRPNLARAAAGRGGATVGRRVTHTGIRLTGWQSVMNGCSGGGRLFTRYLFILDCQVLLSSRGVRAENFVPLYMGSKFRIV